MEKEKMISFVEKNFKNIWQTLCMNKGNSSLEGERSACRVLTLGILHDMLEKKETDQPNAWLAAEKKAASLMQKWMEDVGTVNWGN